MVIPDAILGGVCLMFRMYNILIYETMRWLTENNQTALSSAVERVLRTNPNQSKSSSNKNDIDLIIFIASKRLEERGRRGGQKRGQDDLSYA